VARIRVVCFKDKKKVGIFTDQGEGYRSSGGMGKSRMVTWLYGVHEKISSAQYVRRLIDHVGKRFLFLKKRKLTIIKPSKFVLFLLLRW
jgi:hypothetical protein